ncbi:hypothetical protein GSI_08326 [Ganoderma sinense ZZ0214-1]|uniref:Uncharacterized protein n=1 Tax=Ganoderma sinense ZZ0214-1 TaxID=1077348 RepID=A0A2G8S7J0_9APHY|nr:hypothetical protein GSI_08326 [Ganoderma sinense ZZ0214-1]
MSGPEPGWEQRPGDATNAYTRPLIGSELWYDQSMRLQDGLSQFAIGVQFTTTIHERDIEARVKAALVRLRFECPLVAATIERGTHHPEFRSWVYAPLPSAAAARAWADQTVHYLRTPADPFSFLHSTVETTTLPHVLADGSEQFLRVYLTRPSAALNVYCLAFHTVHSIADAKPALNALSLLLEWMAAPEVRVGDGPGEDLAWGTEQKNLPPGPVTVTGGPREDWGTNGMALIQKFQTVFVEPTPSHGLECDTSGDKPEGSGMAHRLLVRFTVQESAKIGQALKALGFTFSELLDAAGLLAAFAHNPVPAGKVDTALIKGASLITLTDRLPPAVDRRRHLVSCLVFAAYRLPYAPLAALPAGRARLLAALRETKEHYDAWLANPCLPHLVAEFGPYIAPTKVVEAPPPGPYVPMMTNVGRVEDYVAPVWPREGEEGGASGGEKVIRVEDMHMVCRMGRVWVQPTLHSWSIQGRLSVLLEAAGVWDKDVLQDYLNEVVKQISLIFAE